MSFNFSGAKNVTIAFGSIGAGYAVAIADAVGTFLEVKNTTNQDLVLRTKSLLPADVEVRLLAGDFSSKLIPLVHKGNIEIKHAGVAPSSGSLFIQTIRDGK